MRKGLTLALCRAFVGIGVLIFFTPIASDAFTSPYYSYGDANTTSAVWLPNAEAPTWVQDSNANGSPTSTSISAGHPTWDIWGYYGVNQTPIFYIPASYGSVTAQAANGIIQAKTSAYHGGNNGDPVSWEVQLPGTNPFNYQPFNWGEATSFGYIRSVWQITSSDGSLQVGDPVTIQAGLDFEGELHGYTNSVRAMLFLNNMADVSWLDQNEFLPFSIVDDFQLIPDLSFTASKDDGGTRPISNSDTTQKGFQVGDIIVLEALLGTSSALINDGNEREIWADFENTLHSSIGIQTPGADLQPYGDQVPVPGTVFLLGLGMIGLTGLRRRFGKP